MERGFVVEDGLEVLYFQVMNQDRKTFLVAISCVIFAIIMGGLTWFLNYMGLEFILGALFGATLIAGCLGIALKEVRDLS